VKEWLRQKHSQCERPVAVLPPISLFNPAFPSSSSSSSHHLHHHHDAACVSSPAAFKHPSFNFVRRHLQRELRGDRGCRKGRQLTRRLVYGRFRPWRVHRNYTGTSGRVCAFTGIPGVSRLLVVGEEEGIGQVQVLQSLSMEMLDDIQVVLISLVIIFNIYLYIYIYIYQPIKTVLVIISLVIISLVTIFIGDYLYFYCIHQPDHYR
jgi:hypothetical protein